MITEYCPFCREIHKVGVVFKPTSERIKNYTVVYNKKFYHCQVTNKMFQTKETDKYNDMIKTNSVNNFNK